MFFFLYVDICVLSKRSVYLWKQERCERVEKRFFLLPGKRSIWVRRRPKREYLKRYCQHKIYISLNVFEWFLVRTIKLIIEIRVIQKKISVFTIVRFSVELFSVRRNRCRSTNMNRFSRNATFVWPRVYKRDYSIK